MFYSDYKTKSTATLIEIVNSDSYQLSAKETAKQILEERGEKDFISSKKDEYQESDVYDLFSKLNTYRLNVEASRKKETISIKKDNKGFVTGIILIALALTIFLLILFFDVYVQTAISIGNFYANRYLRIAIGLFIIGGIAQIQSDKMSKIKIDYKKGEIETTKKQRMNKKKRTYFISNTKIFIRRDETSVLNIISNTNGAEHIEIKFKDRNIKDKTDQLIEELNKKIYYNILQ